jgi:hypothetical protein
VLVSASRIDTSLSFSVMGKGSQYFGISLREPVKVSGINCLVKRRTRLPT